MWEHKHVQASPKGHMMPGRFVSDESEDAMMQRVLKSNEDEGYELVSVITADQWWKSYHFFFKRPKA